MTEADPTELMPRRAKPDVSYDVIVAGGGPAGIGAALAAAITGARTLMLEARSQFGGTATAAMWMPINMLYKDSQHTSRGGVHTILIDTLLAMGADAARHGETKRGIHDSGTNLNVHPEYLKKALYDLFEQYEIDYQLYSPVVDVVKEATRVTGVVVGAKEGRVTFNGTTMIDCTGDGDVAFLAGCEMAAQGDEDTGWRPPVTVAWAVCNVDCDTFYSWLERGMELDRNQFRQFNELIGHYRAKGYNLPWWIGLNKTTVPGVVSMNNGTSHELHLDCSKSATLTMIEKMAIDQALEFIRFVRDEKVPGMEHACLMRTGGFAMARDTRRLVGEYVFTGKDVMQGTEFEDAVASKYGASDPVGAQRPYTSIKQGAQFPYRAMLPKEIDGLLVAGRCSSATMLGHYGGKSMGNMMSMGQAAGVAAALCASRGETPRELDYHLIQSRLDEMGVSL